VKWKQLIPRRLRRLGRSAWKDLPNRLADLPEDLADLFRADPLPPPRLRFRVSGTSSRSQYLNIGRQAAKDLANAFLAQKEPDRQYRTWLDFGSGAGRIARWISKEIRPEALYCVDTDAGAIAWARRRLPIAEFRESGAAPPLAFSQATMDVIYTVSVLTHMDESQNLEWLTEFRRLLRPGGLLLVSSHGPELTFTRPDLTVEQHETLGRRGFLFAPGDSGFNEDTAFHTWDYMTAAWRSLFEPLAYVPFGLTRFQDLSVWRRSDPTGAGRVAPAPPTSA